MAAFLHRSDSLSAGVTCGIALSLPDVPEMETGVKRVGLMPDV